MYKRFGERMTENKRFMVDDAGTLIDIQTREMYDIVEEVCSVLNALYNENEQLKQRNTNQYNQLNQLWQLIEAKDWETLTAMDNQMKEDEEQLQKEWKCYCE